MSYEGKQLRMTIARACARDVNDARFMQAIDAVQLAHEASLIHDDVIDNASTRRGKPSFHAEKGIGAAIVKGDAMLARGYAQAIGTGSPTFASAYAHAIEMTIAGEIEQAKRLGDTLAFDEYEAIIAMKSGDLIALAFATQALLDADRAAIDRYMLGRRVGTFYQMVDDLIDYLPNRSSGKPAFGDYKQKRWTWPLHFLGISFGRDIERELDFKMIGSCVEYLQMHADVLLGEVAQYEAVADLIRGWMKQVRNAAIEAWVASRGVTDAASYFSNNSKSFSFAARLLPPEYRSAVQSIYAYCRFTDDLVDNAADAPVAIISVLDWWEKKTLMSHEGIACGVAVIDDAMRVSPSAQYAIELIGGMRMDLAAVRYDDMEYLRKYTHRVAGVVGQWLTAVFGSEDPWLLERADELGHAMQLTNILRDVGEDFRIGRIYLPADRMAVHGVTEVDLRRVAYTGQTTPGYRALMDELMAVADESYALAREAIPQLPTRVQRSIAAAASVYQGIHDSLRANGYNNGTVRARTTFAGKIRRALPALLFGLFVLARPVQAQMRDAWVAAANDKGKLASAWQTLGATSGDTIVLMAYRGSLELLESRYGTWPPSRLKHAKRGFELLDRAVVSAPDNAEVRFIRLMSYYHLPGFFKKKDVVAQDITALRTLQPELLNALP